jgi:triacylglycerol lipase
MSLNTHYSAAQNDLFNPGDRNEFFSPRPQSDAALCVEMARLAYCRKEPAFSFDQDRVQKILEGIGFGACQFFESQGRPQGKGVHCFLAVGNDVQKGHKVAVASFRGTDVKDPSNLVYDMDLELEPWDGLGKVHRGFANALNEVRSRLDGAIREIGKCRLVYTGHSLGAAMATLMAGLRPPDALYTFGCPRVGDVTFVAALKNVRSYRYVDCCDLVARIPLESMGFQHVGEPYYIKRNRKLSVNPSEKSIRWDHVLAVAEYVVRYAFRKGNERVRELADHAPINYVWPVKASQP